MPFENVLVIPAHSSFENLPKAQQLRRLIEAHTSVSQSYGRCYRAMRNMLAEYRELPEGSRFGYFSRDELVAAASEARDFVAKFYQWCLRALELNANELAPGTYSAPVPTTSMDWDEWQRAIKEYQALLAAMAKNQEDHGNPRNPDGSAPGQEVGNTRSTMSSVGF